MTDDFAEFNEADDTDGEPVCEMGGVGGEVKCTGFVCDWSTVCNMIAV